MYVGCFLWVHKRVEQAVKAVEMTLKGCERIKNKIKTICRNYITLVGVLALFWLHLDFISTGSMGARWAHFVP